MTRRSATPPGILLLLLLFLAAAPSPGEMNVKKLADGVWASTTDRGANVGWFVDGACVIAVDAGSSAEEGRNILAKIRQTAGLPVRFLVVTHAHGDHAGGTAEFVAAGARVVSSENASGPLLSAMQAELANRPGAPGGKKPAAAIQAEVLAVASRLQGLGGTRRFEINYLGPAHTDGDLIVALPDEKILFSGDIAVNAAPYMRSKGLDPRGWSRILSGLKNLPVEQLVPGHGSIGPTEGIANTLYYVSRADEIARRLAEAKVPDADLDRKLREPENTIEKVAMSEDYVANMRAVVQYEKEKLAKPSPATPGKGN